MPQKKFAHKDKIEVIYKLFILDSHAPLKTTKSAIEELALSKGIELKKAEVMYENVAIMARTEGLSYNLDKIQATSTNDAHRLLKWAYENNKGKELTEKLFEGYFTLGLNIADHETLINIIKKLALNIDQAKEILAINSYEQAVQLDLKEAYDLGITSVPTFVIDRKYGISGAQKEGYFLEMIKAAYDELYPKNLKMVKEDLSCTADGYK